MMPDNIPSTEVIKGRYLFPDAQVGTRLEDWELGGIALQNTSEGLEYQAWYGYWQASDSTVYLLPANSTVPIPLMTQADVVEFTFSFDQNMRYVVALLLDTGELKLYWYNSVIGAYAITSYFNIISAKLSLDDKRIESVLADTSDVILTYITESLQLYTRIQRERYLIEHDMDTDMPAGCRITNFGMTDVWRMQWRFESILRS